MKGSPLCVVRVKGPPTWGRPTAWSSRSLPAYYEGEVLGWGIEGRTALLDELFLLVTEVEEEGGAGEDEERGSLGREYL